MKNIRRIAPVAAVFISGVAAFLLTGSQAFAISLSPFTEAAAAQTAFQADVTATMPLPVTQKGACSNDAVYCGTADIAGYGAASWNLYLTGLTPSPTSCGSTYTATTDFTLTSDGSTLELNESGYVCGPGNDAAGFFSEGPNAYGSPNYPFGTWTVDTANSTGQFAGLGGSGADALHVAGAHVSGNYTGTLGP